MCMSKYNYILIIADIYMLLELVWFAENNAFAIYKECITSVPSTL